MDSTAAFRHVSSSDGQDWLLNGINCTIPEVITNIKLPLGFTLRIEDALIPGATAFRDFDNTKHAALWEIIFQQFLFLCETIGIDLENMIKRCNGSIGETDIIQFYLEPVLDNDKFIEDITTPYCKTSAVAYTFWVFIKDIGRPDINFDVDTIYSKIVDTAVKFSKGLEGQNFTIASTILKKILDKQNGGDSDDEEENEKKKKKKEIKKSTIKDVLKNERWKLLPNRSMLAYIFDMMAQNEGWQTYRLDKLTHFYNSMKNSPTKATTLFNCYTALYARPTTCIKNQSIFHIEKIFEHCEDTGLYNVRFPMRKYVLRIPAINSITDIINRKLPLYQLNTISSIASMIPIILDDLETKLEDEQKLKELTSKGIVKEKGKSAWSSSYDDYLKTLNYVNGEEEDCDDDDDVNNELQRLRARVTSLKIMNRLPSDPHAAIKAIKDSFVDDKRAKSKMRAYGSGNAFDALLRASEKYGLTPLLTNVAEQRKGKISKLVASQLSNCTTLWPEGTDTRDNTQDENYHFISIYAILAAQSKAGRDAIKRMIARIDDKQETERHLDFKNECIRKMIVILKRHMLKEYVTKCLSTTAYGISPAEKSAIKFTRDHNPFDYMISHSKFDDTLSLFATDECRTYLRMQHFTHIGTLQRELSLLAKYAADSWRMSYDLHLHSLLNSQKGGTGKTTIQDEMKEWCMPGTVTTEGYRSTKSDSVSGNHNGSRYVWPELQQSVVDDSDPKNEQARMIKDTLTSCKSTGTRLVKNPETGNFEREHIDAHVISTITGSTNVNPHELSQPIKSRFHILNIANRVKPFRTTTDSKTAEYMAGDRLDDEKQKFRREQVQKDWFIFHIERLIAIGVLDQPSWEIGWFFMTLLSRTLNEKGIIHDDVRVNYCINVLARQNLIRECVEKLWFHKGAKYNGKKIEFEQFLDLDPMLTLNTGVIVAAIGESYDRIINPAADTVRKCIKQLFQEEDRNCRFMIRKKIQKKDSDRPSRRSCFDYNWIRFPFGINPDIFYDKICAVSNRFEDGISLTKYIIQEVFGKWSECRIDAPFYAIGGDLDLDDPRQEDERMPEEYDMGRIQVAENKGIKKQPLVTVSGNNIYFLFHYFREETPKSSLDVLKDTIVDILSCARQSEDKFIFNNNQKFPFIRDILEVKEIGDKIMVIPTPNVMKDDIESILLDSGTQKSKFEPKSMKEVSNGVYAMVDQDRAMEASDMYAIAEDLNTYAIKRRNKRLYITDSKINGAYANFNLFSGTVKRNINTRNMNETEKSALPFKEDQDYSKDSNGYFMGEPLDQITSSNNIFDVETLEKNLDNFYRELDTVDESGEDHDFDPEEYSIEAYTSIDDGTTVKKYHWEYFTGTKLSSPQTYKLLRFHPKIIEDFFNKKNQVNRVRGLQYPESVIKLYNDAMKSQDSISALSILSTRDLGKFAKEGKLYLEGYVAHYDESHKLKKLHKDRDDPYNAVATAFPTKKKNQPKPQKPLEPKNKRADRPTTDRQFLNLGISYMQELKRKGSQNLAKLPPLKTQKIMPKKGAIGEDSSDSIGEQPLDMDVE